MVPVGSLAWELLHGKGTAKKKKDEVRLLPVPDPPIRKDA